VKLGLFTAWMAQIGLITWRTFSQGKRAPLPSELAATVVVYGTLSVLSGGAETPAAVVGWGLVVANLLNVIDPTNPTGKGAVESGQAPASPTSQPKGTVLA
jgi:hypothetical protein